MNVSVGKAKLLQILQENLEKHKIEYNKAVIVWKEDVVKALQKSIDKVNNTAEPISVYTNLPLPEEHIKDYEHVIKMVGFDTREILVLEEQEAKEFLGDDWNWKRSFTANTMSYSSKSIS